MATLHIISDTVCLALLALAACTDLAGRRIPNSVAAAIAIIAAATTAATEPSQFLLSGCVAILLLLFGIVLFLKHYVGGGDVKLVPAVSLMFPPNSVPLFLVAMALFGGLIAVAFMVADRQKAAGAKRPMQIHQKNFNPLRLSDQLGQGIPYAVAIFAGASLVKLIAP